MGLNVLYIAICLCTFKLLITTCTSLAKKLDLKWYIFLKRNIYICVKFLILNVTIQCTGMYIGICLDGCLCVLFISYNVLNPVFLFQSVSQSKVILYFFLLMLYKTSTCKIFWLCAVVVFFTTFIHWRHFFFFLSICKSNIPLTNVIMNLK